MHALKIELVHFFTFRDIFFWTFHATIFPVGKKEIKLLENVFAPLFLRHDVAFASGRRKRPTLFPRQKLIITFLGKKENTFPVFSFFHFQRKSTQKSFHHVKCGFVPLYESFKGFLWVYFMIKEQCST